MENVQNKLERYAKYKDSGVEWLDEIPKHWNVYPMKAVTRVRSESNAPNSELLSVYLDKGVIPFSSVKAKRTNVTSLDLSNYQVVQSGDFVLNNQQAWRGSVGVSAHKGIISPAYIVLELNEKFNSDYANYMFRNSHMVSQYLVCSKGVGTIQRNLYWPYLKSTKLFLPPLNEQTEITSFLDKKCRKIYLAITQKEKLIVFLRERKQIIIQSAVIKGINSGVKMKNSGIEWIGEIPEHWEVIRNNALFEERNQPGQKNLPLLTVSIHTAVSTGELDKEDNIRGKVKIEDKSKYKLVEVNDIVFNMMRAWQGAIGSVQSKGMVSPAYIVAAPSDKIDSVYFEYLYRTSLFIQEMNRFSKGITDFRKRLYWDEFKQLISILPPIEEQKAIVSHIVAQSSKIDKAISLQEKQIEKLKEYKTILINSAVTGKIKVCEDA